MIGTQPLAQRASEVAVDADVMHEVDRRPRTVGLDRQHQGDVVDHWIIGGVAQQVRQFARRRRPVHRLGGKPSSIQRLEPGQQLDGQQRVATEVEEGVVEADRVGAEHLAEQFGDPLGRLGGLTGGLIMGHRPKRSRADRQHREMQVVRREENACAPARRYPPIRRRVTWS